MHGVRFARVTIAVLVLSGAAALPRVSADTSPPNDAFSAAIDVSMPGSIAGDNQYATTEPGEPGCAQFDSTIRTVWYRVRPATAGDLWMSAAEGFGSELAVYQGASLTDLVQLVCGSSSLPRVRVTADATYYIQVGAYTSAAYPGGSKPWGNFTLNLEFDAAPSNDDFGSAMRLLTDGVALDGMTVGASAEPGEPLSYCFSPVRTVWYAITAPSSETLAVTVSSTFLTRFAALLYEGTSFSDLHRLAAFCGSSGPSETLRVVARAGVIYYLQIIADAYSRARIPFHVAAAMEPPPANDSFASAAPIPLGAGARGFFDPATIEPGEPPWTCGGSAAAHTLWYDVVPSRWSRVQFALGATGPLALSIYRGSELGSLELLACTKSSASFPTLELEPGVTYFLQAAGVGQFGLGTYLVPPPGDDFRYPVRTEISVSSGGFFASFLTNATLQAGEPLPSCAPAAEGSIWIEIHSWDRGLARAIRELGQKGVISSLAIYRGPPDLASLREVSCVQPTDQLPDAQADMEANETVFLQVTGRGDFRLFFELVTPPANDAFAAATEIALPARLFQPALTRAARLESGEPTACGPLTRTVWYRFVAPRSSPFTAEVSWHTFDPRMALYTGDSLATLQLVACSTRATYEERLATSIVKGQTYYLQVGTRVGDRGGSFDLMLGLELPPVNDTAATALNVKPNAELSGSSRFALTEADDPFASCGQGVRRTVWYAVTANRTGTLTVHVRSADPDGALSPVLTLYVGSAVPPRELACNEGYANDSGQALVSASVTNDATYLVRIGGSGGGGGIFHLETSLR